MKIRNIIIAIFALTFLISGVAFVNASSDTENNEIQQTNWDTEESDIQQISRNEDDCEAEYQQCMSECRPDAPDFAECEVNCIVKRVACYKSLERTRTH